MQHKTRMSSYKNTNKHFSPFPQLLISTTCNGKITECELNDELDSEISSDNELVREAVHESWLVVKSETFNVFKFFTRHKKAGADWW